MGVWVRFQLNPFLFKNTAVSSLACPQSPIRISEILSRHAWGFIRNRAPVLSKPDITVACIQQIPSPWMSKRNAAVSVLLIWIGKLKIIILCLHPEFSASASALMIFPSYVFINDFVEKFSNITSKKYIFAQCIFARRSYGTSCMYMSYFNAEFSIWNTAYLPLMG